jgi:hypothetical protein
MPGIPPAGKDFGGLTLTGRLLFNGCRARAPVERHASDRRDGLIYSFGTGGNLGCSGFEGVPEEMFLELLGGISLDKAGKE